MIVSATSKVCDRKTGHGCGIDKDSFSVKLASAQMHLKIPGFLTRNRTSIGGTTPTLFRSEVDLSSVARQYFPEVWLFEDYNLGFVFSFFSYFKSFKLKLSANLFWTAKSI